jgi:hypothetical protein
MPETQSPATVQNPRCPHPLSVSSRRISIASWLIMSSFLPSCRINRGVDAEGLCQGDHVERGGVDDHAASATVSTLCQSGCSKSVATKSWLLFHCPTVYLQIGTKRESTSGLKNR